jgi:hypothetical protein
MKDIRFSILAIVVAGCILWPEFTHAASEKTNSVKIDIQYTNIKDQPHITGTYSSNSFAKLPTSLEESSAASLAGLSSINLYPGRYKIGYICGLMQGKISYAKITISSGKRYSLTCTKGVLVLNAVIQPD